MSDRIPTRERRPSVGVPVVDIQGAVSPAGMTRPKHKRTFTGFGPQEIKTVEGTLPRPPQMHSPTRAMWTLPAVSMALAGFPVAAHPPPVIRAKCLNSLLPFSGLSIRLHRRWPPTVLWDGRR